MVYRRPLCDFSQHLRARSRLIGIGVMYTALWGSDEIFAFNSKFILFSGDRWRRKVFTSYCVASSQLKAMATKSHFWLSI